MTTRVIGNLGLLALACLISGCFDDHNLTRFPASGIIQRPESGADLITDSAPVLTGIRYVSATLDAEFVFQPTAWDPDDDPLHFSIENQPAWVQFDELTGMLTGVPEAGDLGTSFDVVIGASDATSTAYLDLTIQVVDATTHSVTLVWYPPTENEDSTPLMDLAGYRIRYGPEPEDFSYEIDIPNPGITAYVVQGLVSGTHYFTLSAYNTVGVESEASGTSRIQL